MLTSSADFQASILGAWATANRITILLVENLSPEALALSIPGAPRRTIRMVAGHMHNARCTWLKTLGHPFGIAVPRSVDRHRATGDQLVKALRASGTSIGELLELGCDRGGHIPATAAYTWRNLPLDVGHVLGYFIAHEGHHRGQIVLAARAHGERLPTDVVNGLWQWRVNE